MNAHDFYQEMIKMIDEAKFSVHLQTYIFKHDEIGRRVVNALKRAADRGVRVYFMVDRLGSTDLSAQFTKDLKKSKIRFHLFGKLRWMKVLSRAYFVGRRLHHKVFVVDEKTAIIGGINIGEEFLTWYDFAVKFEGESVNDLLKAAYKYWPFFIRRKLLRRLKPIVPDGDILANVITNDGLMSVERINRRYDAYLKLAKKEIFIVSAYFFPSPKFLKKLYEVSQRGVKIKVLCNYRTDIPLLSHATSFYYKTLLKNNIEVIEWLPTVLHGKAAIIDDEILTLGSYNLNYMSYYTNIELNLEIVSSTLTRNFKKNIEDNMKDKIRIITPELLPNKLSARFLSYVAYKIVRFVSIISVIFVKNTKRISADDI